MCSARAKASGSNFNFESERAMSSAARAAEKRVAVAAMGKILNFMLLVESVTVSSIFYEQNNQHTE